MKKIYQTLLIVILAITSFTAFSQDDDMALGDWKYFLTYKTGFDVTQSDDAVYYASNYGVLIFYKEDLSTKFLSKLDILSDISPRKIKYNKHTRTLIIGYKNANIDLLTNDGIYNIPYFKNSEAIFGKKHINNIYTQDKYAYLATDFGLSVLDLDTKTIFYTTFIPYITYEITIFNGFLYASTKRGIYKININHVNIADFNNWTKLEEGFPSNYESKAIGFFNDALYAGMDDHFIKIVNDTAVILAEPFTEPEDQHISYISDETSRLMVGYTSGLTTFAKLHIYKQDTIWYDSFSNDCRYRTLNAVEDQDGRMWYADQFNGIRQSNQYNYGCETHTFNTPISYKNVKTVFHDDEVWVASGAYRDDGTYNAFKEGVYIYENGVWDNIHSNDPQLTDKWMWDMLDIAFHPETGDAYIGTFVGGVIHKKDDVLTIYDKDNSSLKGAVGDSGRTRIGGLAFDQNNNLWISNHSAPNPISVLKDDGSWHNLTPNVNTQFLDVVVDHNNYKWFIIGQGGGVVVYDEGESIENTTDDRYRLFTAGSSNLPNNNVKSVVVDLDGAVWVGTSEGVVKFDCGSDVFDTQRCKGTLNIVNVNGDNAYLLGTEEVKTIAVDGANRKWFGTTNGIFVQSADGNSQLYNFTKENSPLPDNTIYNIAVNPKDGTVYISTESGLVTYRGEATYGDDTHSSDIFAYPNPVRPGYSGPVAIRGLAKDSNVKITDISGRLITEGKAFGGQFIWKQTDYNGQNVSSGVYLVYATSSESFDSPDTAVTKILVVR